MFPELNGLAWGRHVRNGFGMGVGRVQLEGNEDIATQSPEAPLSLEHNAVNESADPDFLILMIIRDGAK